MIATVVEGYGEVKAVPVLLRRIAEEVVGRYDVHFPTPWRLPRHKMGTMEIARAAQVLAERSDHRVLVIVDADDDCAVDLAARISAAMSPWSGETAVAVREFEAWFLAGLGGLRSHSAVSSSARFDSDPESPRDAKGRLSQMMTEPYREPLHQARFASAMDIQEARRTRSFAHLVSCVERLLVGGSTSAQ